MKFNIGDKAFIASINRSKKHHPCPDCGGVTKWKLTSPLGREIEVPCPRCSAGYISDKNLSLDYWEATPDVKEITIGLVRSEQRLNGEEKVEYMESTSGSGFVYKEDDLFDTYEKALASADAKAAVRNMENAANIEAHIPATLVKFHDYELHDAQIKSAECSAREARYKHEDFVRDLRYALEDKDYAAIRDLIGEDK
jgi:hypothetical protein